jgi:hypothetical protein
MARGWESKSVEAQQEEAVSDAGKERRQLTAEQVAARNRRAELGLMCRKLQHDLDAATNPRHREMLEQALQDLGRQLAAMTSED